MVTQRLVLQTAVFPRPEGESRTRSRLPCERSPSPRAPERILPSSFGAVGKHRVPASDSPFPVSTRWTRRAEPDWRSRGSFSQRLPEGSEASVEGWRRQNRCSLRETSMASSASRSRGALPSKRWRANRGTIQQTKAVRRTPRLQRTPEAFSPAVACGVSWLRGRTAACNGRTLKRQPLCG